MDDSYNWNYVYTFIKNRFEKVNSPKPKIVISLVEKQRKDMVEEFLFRYTTPTIS